MSKYDLHPTRNGTGYLLDLQTDFLAVQRSRMMAPVMPVTDVPQRTTGLHPLIEVDGISYVVATHLMAAVPQSILLPSVANFSSQADEFTRALDLLFQGY